MTRDEIMKLKGRELDYKIAKDILDLDCLKDPPYGILLPVEVLVQEYHSDMRATMIAVEKLQELELFMHWPGQWQANALFAGGEWSVASANTAPLAVCYAILLAKENL